MANTSESTPIGIQKKHNSILIEIQKRYLHKSSLVKPILLGGVRGIFSSQLFGESTNYTPIPLSFIDSDGSYRSPRGQVNSIHYTDPCMPIIETKQSPSSDDLYWNKPKRKKICNWFIKCSDAHMHCCIGSSLLRVMACHLFQAKLFIKPINSINSQPCGEV